MLDTMTFETSPLKGNSAIDPALNQLFDKDYPPNFEIFANPNPESTETGRPLVVIITSNCREPLTFIPDGSSSEIRDCDNGTDFMQSRTTTLTGAFETPSSSPKRSLPVILRHVENEFATFINEEGILRIVSSLDYVGVHRYALREFSNRFYPIQNTVSGTSMSAAIEMAQYNLGISRFNSVKFIPNPELRHNPITLAIKIVETEFNLAVTYFTPGRKFDLTYAHAVFPSTPGFFQFDGNPNLVIEATLPGEIS